MSNLNNRDLFQRNCLGLAFCIALSLGGANLALAGNEGDNHRHKNDGPDGNTYLVHVKSSFGTKFDDCYSFDHNSPGTLTIQWLGEPLTYAHDDLNKDDEDWQATSQAYAFLGIAFHGSTDHHGEKIKGNAVSEFGDTFVFKGEKSKKCEVETLRTQTANPYRQ